MIRGAFKKKCTKGFSLVEVLCAIVLLALVATPILQIIFSSLSVNAKSRKILAATDLASDTIGYINTCSFEDYSATQKGLESYYYGEDTPSVDDLELFYGKISTGGSNYTGQVALYNKYSNGGTVVYGPSGQVDQDSLSNYSNSTFTGRKLQVKNVDYSGYKFDVDVYVLKNNSASGLYYNYDCYVEVFEPATYDSEGNLLSHNSMIKLSTSVPNTFKSKN